MFSFPLSIRFLIYEQNSYRFGNFNPWVTGFVYLPELLLIITFGCWLFNQSRTKKLTLNFESKPLWMLFFLFVINAYLVTLINGDSALAALFLLRVFEVLMVFWLIVHKVLEPRPLVKILLLGALFQIAWGYAQWHLNHSLGFTFLGESVLSSDLLGVAKIDLANGAKQIRAYGSFLHPNILGAYLVIIFFLALKYFKYRTELFWLIIFVGGIYLTQSKAAMVAGISGLILYFVFAIFKKHTRHRRFAYISLILIIIGHFWLLQNSDSIYLSNPSWQARLEQNTISQNMLKSQPLGVGVGNFTLEMENYSANKKLMPWDFQPVHNIYFLMLNELGIQGIILFFSFLFLLFQRYWHYGKALSIFILLALGLFDHLLLTSWTGLMLIALVAGLFSLENKTSD